MSEDAKDLQGPAAGKKPAAKVVTLTNLSKNPHSVAGVIIAPGDSTQFDSKALNDEKVKHKVARAIDLGLLDRK